MLPKSEAESRWCPFALTESEVKECDFSGNWIDSWPNRVARRYETNGKIIAVTVINRTIEGNPHPDCLCITDKCIFWRKLDEDGNGDCSKLDDNMNDRDNNVNDASMQEKWCPHARPENAVVTRPWNGTISGCTVAISSANREPGGANKTSANCVTVECMAYCFNGANGYCMSADKNMQGL
jgi:hypothetical protein